MDLLCQRYANPYFLLEQMVQQGRLLEFVIELYKMEIEKEDEQKLWDIWLHRVFDKTFDEWKESIQIKQVNPPDKPEIEATVTNSINILNGFNPNDGR